MKIGTKEHYDMMNDFEKNFHGRFDKEPKDLWCKGIFYQDGNVNNLFRAYSKGYAAARAEYLNQ